MSLNKMMIDEYLRQVGKKYRKMQGKKMPAEIILIGGASCIINYGFREVTNDVDGLYINSSALKDAIKEVGRENNIGDDWLNDDFKFTSSFSDKIILHSTYYKEFSNCLTVRTVKSEYLVAMKLKSNRAYKNDLSDIVGILREQLEIGEPLNFEKIDSAVKSLFGDWTGIDESTKNNLIDLLSLDADSLSIIYDDFRNLETSNADILLNLVDKYKISDNNANDILSSNEGEVNFKPIIKDIKDKLK